MNENSIGESVAPEKMTENKINMVVIDGVLTVAQLPKIMAEFRKPIDTLALQESKTAETQKGYDTLGYGYAWISERLNDVVGFCWRVVENNEKVENFKTKGGNDMHEVTIDITLQLGNWRNKEIEESTEVALGEVTKTIKTFKIAREFEVLCETPVGHGWHRSFNIADARKGAMTNGFKKAAGFFGIGNEAYKKSIDEENAEIKETLAKKRGKKRMPVQSVVAQASSEDLQKIHQKLESLGARDDQAKLDMLRDKFKFTAMDMKKLNEKQVKLLLARILNSQQ